MTSNHVTDQEAIDTADRASPLMNRFKGSANEPGRRIPVLFPVPVDNAFDYLAPSIEVGFDDPLTAGTFVRAPFGGRDRIGIVWPLQDQDENQQGAPEERPEDNPLQHGDNKVVALEKLKSVETRIDAPPLSQACLDFIKWLSDYTMAPLGMALRLFIRSGDVAVPPSPKTGYRRVVRIPETIRLTDARKNVLAMMSEQPQPMALIAAKTGASDAVVRSLAKAGGLERVDIDPDTPFSPPNASAPAPDFSREQAHAVSALADHIRGGEGTILLDGVTGAGKTEVYLEAVAETLKLHPDAQVLVMLPEIALTMPFLDRISSRFEASPAAWHSDLTAVERRRVWRRVADGNAKVVVGARSALFLPYQNLKLIVVDEEHETAYKQDEGVVYQARDLAVARGDRGRFPVVLSSATPSLETVVNVDQGKYAITRLRARFGGAKTPDISLIDLRKSPPEKDHWLSPEAVDAINQEISNGNQALLFLNRRGYAPLTICRKCGERIKSPYSDTWMVEHRFERKLVCHHTGFSMPKPSACPSCKAVDSLHPCGPGVERVAEEAAERWPNARQAVLSSDTAPTPAAMREILDRMKAGDIDILIATQVVAKGHHFPDLTLVVVVDADMGLAGGDLRAGEKTFQLLSQVAGRSGRGQNPGRALLQTHQPDAAVLQA
ncbi:MAG: primosomal protein N', partial [Pseudomonadota bacterium]